MAKKKAVNYEEKHEEIKPEKVKLPFLKKKRGIWGKITGKEEEYLTGQELLENEPILIYMDENKDITIYTNIKAGLITAKDKDGRIKDYQNLIESGKMCKLHYGDQRINCYVHYEKEYLGYPSEPKIDAKTITKAIRTLQANYMEADKEHKGGFFAEIFGSNVMWKHVLLFLGGLTIIVIGAIFVWNMFDLGQVFGIGQQAVETTTQAIANNVTTNIQGTTTIVP